MYNEELLELIASVKRAEALTMHVQAGVLAAWVFTEATEAYIEAEAVGWLAPATLGEVADLAVLFLAYQNKTGKQFLALPTAATVPEENVLRSGDVAALVRAMFLTSRGIWRRGVKPLDQEDTYFQIVKEGLALLCNATAAFSLKSVRDAARTNRAFYSDNQGYIHQLKEESQV